MSEVKIDIKENALLKLDTELLTILLKDMSSGKNILWGTDNYIDHGFGYAVNDEIFPRLLTGKNGNILKPRVEKSKREQQERIKGKAEVFTPSWICNKQNNLVDNAWFGRENVFNTEFEKTWKTTEGKIVFPSEDGKSWQDYVNANRLEISCGEAPYLASRYDAVTGEIIPVKDRIGLLDRKLRVVSENTEDEQDWYEWAKKAIQSVYGYDWQGDNVLLARENLLYTFSEHYEYKFGVPPIKAYLREVATILAWNVWQMDGLKFVIPNSCKKQKPAQLSIFDDENKEEECIGCKTNNPKKHNGIYCYIKDWQAKRKIKFVSFVKGGEK